MKIQKTNAMRELDTNNISYEVFEYPHGKDAVDGIEVARLLNEDSEVVFKTLVTKSNTNEYIVYMIPVCKELDLKKCAVSAGVKNVEMIPVKDITKVTGYVRGGCSPLAQKKKYRTFIDETAILYDFIYFSAGKIGMQIKMDPNALIELLDIKTFDLVK